MVAIKDMKMPKSCIRCQVSDSVPDCPCKGNTLIFNYRDKRHPDCPLIEIGVCKKCRHWDKSEEHCSRLSSDNGWFEDEYYRVYTESDFYCKYFEKRNDENG